ncbi:MAG TPA: 3-hydroxyacyl-CoA dehydrogenase family protein [Solirubrobacteraceae bacterium]|jgi:3-hydroxybutyryl-CoA dehydrogenase|nr:3-hydroxyacyl-CoA dehydrogenase family protein [Solirubrobacteraceae bacterium]
MEITHVGVVGCGTMGHGIAQISAQAGFQVVVREVSEEALTKGLGRISKSLQRLLATGRLSGDDDPETIEARITPTLAYSDMARCDLVIEAVPEDLPTKLGVWRALDEVLDRGAVCATNTSSLSVIDQAMATSRPERFIGLHFFNPPHVMTLLEVVRTVATNREALQVGVDYGIRLGKDLVHTPDRAGFIVNRLLVPYTMDAVRALENGHGSMLDIDTAMRAGAGHPMGPFTLLDFVGLDVVLAITEAMFTEYREPRFAAPPTIRKLVAAGYLGRKSQRGFYDYSTGEPVPADLALGAPQLTAVTEALR